MKTLERSKRIQKILKGLKTLYPDAHCELNFRSPWELAVATILSAQCTDKRVNSVTPALFKRYPTIQDYAKADIHELESLIRSTGFFRSKALSIQQSARTLLEDFNGQIPKTIRELTQLRGVARKTANVILGTAFGVAEGIVVDTHVKRLSFRLGLTKKTNPVPIERDLMSIIPKEEWIFFGHALVRHGRQVCSARKPRCSSCRLKPLCPYGIKNT